jgi:hypothetical protein
MFKDDVRTEVFDQLRSHDLRVFAKQLTFEVLVTASQRAGLRIWTCPLNLANLVWLGISAAWRKGESFVTILTVTLKLLQDQEHFAQSDFGKDLAKRKRKRPPRPRTRKGAANTIPMAPIRPRSPKKPLPRPASVCRWHSGWS